MNRPVPTFEEFVEPLLGTTEQLDGTTPLAAVPAGQFAVLAWLDDVLADHPADVEADVIARWDALSLHDVYAKVFTDLDATGVPPS